MANMSRETLLAELEFLAREAHRYRVNEDGQPFPVTMQMLEMTRIAGLLDLIRGLVLVGETEELFYLVINFAETKAKILKIIRET